MAGFSGAVDKLGTAIAKRSPRISRLTKAASIRTYRSTWLYLDGAFGFWGKVSLSILLAMATSIINLSQEYPINEDALSQIAQLSDLTPYHAALLIPAGLILTWIWATLVDGFFQMVPIYRRLTNPALSGWRVAIWYTRSYLAVFAYKVAPINGVVFTYLIIPICAVLSFIFYELAHLVRFATGLEPVAFVPLSAFLVDVGDG